MSQDSSEPESVVTSRPLVSDFIGNLWQTRNTSNFKSDVKIYTGGRFVKAHRMILAALSPVLKDVFDQTDPFLAKEVGISLPDISYPDLETLVAFLYTGQGEYSKKRIRVIKKWLGLLQISAKFVDNEPSKISAHQPSQDPSFKHASGLRSFQCKECGAVFYDHKNFRDHMKAAHDQVKIFDCPHCGKSFKFKDSLNTHLRDHTKEYLSCRVCAKQFKHKRDLNDHMNLHSGTNKYLCQDCPRSFSTKKQFFNHRELHKTTTDPCPICSKQMKNMAVLKAHIKSHGKTAAHSCPDCGKAFKRAFDLKVHQRKHTGAKPYTCEFCSKSFSLSSSLARHRRFHTNATSVFPCNSCKEAFASQEDLHLHVETQHASKTDHMAELETDLADSQFVLVDTDICPDMAMTDQMTEASTGLTTNIVTGGETILVTNAPSTSEGLHKP